MLSSRRRRLAGNEEEEAFDDAFLSALGEDEDPMGMGMGMDMMGGGGGGSSGVDFLSAFGMLGGGFGEDESEAEGGFGDDMDLEAFMENFDQCGIDVEELTGKALGAYLLYGGAFSNFDPQDQETYPGVDTIGEVLLAFKDDDEHDCGDSDMSQLLTASTDYLQCSGEHSFQFCSMHDAALRLFSVMLTRIFNMNTSFQAPMIFSPSLKWSLATYLHKWKKTASQL